MMMAFGEYERQNEQDLVIALLKEERGNPLSIEDISFRLKLDKNRVVHVIHSIQHSTELCQENNKFYFPKNQFRWYLAAIGWIIFCAYSALEVIKYYHI